MGPSAWETYGLNEMAIWVLTYPERVKAAAAVRMGAEINWAFNDTQQKVHVLTGALRTSGKVEIEVGLDTWTASIIYGGPSTPHEVDYAIYEMARGGDHDFFRDTSQYQGRLQAALAAGMRDATR